MWYSGWQPNFCGLLQLQHGYYVSELTKTHKQLSKLYKKLYNTERAIAERVERGLTREDKKKLQWSRAITKKAVRVLESEQSFVHENLRQCNHLMGLSYNVVQDAWPAAGANVGVPTQHLQPLDAWSCTTNYQSPIPQYWDLSMLSERRSSSPHAPSADSGFHEVSVYTQTVPTNVFSNVNDVQPHDLESSLHDTDYHSPAQSSKKSSFSEHDQVGDLPSPQSPTRTGAEPATPRRRRYSENAIQLIEKPPRSHTHRS